MLSDRFTDTSWFDKNREESQSQTECWKSYIKNIISEECCELCCTSNTISCACLS